MSESQPPQTPEADGVVSARELLGDKTYETSSALHSCYMALLTQAGSLIGILVMVGIASQVTDMKGALVKTIVSWTALVGITLAQAYSMWCVFRLERAQNSHWLAIAFSLIFVAFPIIGVLSRLAIISPANDALQAAGIPMKRFGPDWASHTDFSPLSRGCRWLRLDLETSWHNST